MIEKEEQQAVIQSPGQILKQARERANLSIQEIADKIKLKKILIENIEQDNYDINISLTFVRGYLKLYAKHVYVEEAEILKAFESLSTQKKEPVKLQSFSRRVANQANDDKLMIVTYLIVAAVIALVVIWWFQQSSTDATSISSPKNRLDSVIPDVIEQEVLPFDTNDTPDIEIVNSTSGDENIFTAEPTLIPLEAEISDASDITITETTSPVELIFEFSGDCWINLSDATGENIAYGVKVKGYVMTQSGIPPFVVTLGAPEAVKIRYAGEPLDMSFLPTGRIAKFDLPLSE
jgi:cytoskeleton protein RodZ